MFVQQFYVEGIAHLSYLVGGKKACAIIDPRRDVDEYLAAAKAMGLKITHILETHLHADFVSGHLDLAQRTGAAIYAPKSGGCKYSHVAVAEGDSFNVEDMRVRVLDTPGHTPDCICYVVTDQSRGDEPVAVFSGDTLFVGDVGRPDLFPGRGKELAASLFGNLKKLMALPDTCLVYPAHGAGSLCGKAMGAMRVSTIGYERAHNPALQHKTLDDFSKALLSGMPEAPDHFARCSDINRRGPALVAELSAPKPLSPAEVQALSSQGHVVLDARDYASFGGAHVPGAINIDGAHNFSTFCGWLLPPDKPIILVARTAEEVPALATMLRRVGLDDVMGYLDGGMGPWITSGLPVARIPTMTVHEAQEACKSKTPIVFLDVRAAGEWNASHIEGATHMPLPATRTQFGELDRAATIALVCKSGARASTAGSILQQKGFRSLAVVAGGMTAWVAAGFAPECATCALTHGPRINQ
ncbi:MAG TPA: rhodanese-like domain-containing protein [Planctomycetota bacterium]|nr:rhodanese-like domain-containing protein [Planctomycetota bacterium]HRR79381.1 rhodanese-like domain-containing protein [Planctomycetota bacterium]HRT93720.1 rhodanese-like domain-containing protein [Planctomycetota bacterium]